MTLGQGNVKPLGHKQQHLRVISNNILKYESDPANGSGDIARTRCVTDGQTDRQTTKAKPICLPSVGGRHKYIPEIDLRSMNEEQQFAFNLIMKTLSDLENNPEVFSQQALANRT